MNPTLPDRIDAAFARLPDTPETRELRQLWEREGRAALHEHRKCGEYVSIPRLQVSKPTPEQP